MSPVKQILQVNGWFKRKKTERIETKSHIFFCCKNLTISGTLIDNLSILMKLLFQYPGNSQFVVDTRFDKTLHRTKQEIKWNLANEAFINAFVVAIKLWCKMQNFCITCTVNWGCHASSSTNNLERKSTNVTQTHCKYLIYSYFVSSCTISSFTKSR